MKPTLITRNTKGEWQSREVKNLGWCLRNYAKISSIHWDSKQDDSGMLTMTLHGGGMFVTSYQSFEVFMNWIDRPVFHGLPVRINDQHTVLMGKVNTIQNLFVNRSNRLGQKPKAEILKHSGLGYIH